MEDNTESITFRSKGVSLKALENEAIRTHPNFNPVEAIFQLYTDLYNGKTIQVNLADGSPVFRFNKDFSINTLNSFVRILSQK
jgi:hypothetical protein